jgi:hypothetical protein
MIAKGISSPRTIRGRRRNRHRVRAWRRARLDAFETFLLSQIGQELQRRVNEAWLNLIQTGSSVVPTVENLTRGGR